ncbi:MAG: signal recognition particle-docking protein FtsY [Snowella sp.]|nr:signal recognition particle-docking protein FtsY [Snowella sp.]
MFNWFRRQFGNESQTEQVPATPESSPSPETDSAVEATEEAETTRSDAGQDAYLQWAKEAYKNIQQRKGLAEEEAVTTSEPEVVDEVLTVEESVETQESVEPVEPIVEVHETIEPEAVEEAIADTETEVEPIPEVVEDVVEEPVAESSEPIEPVATEEEIAQPVTSELETPSTGPAWLQKSDRLEILKETAIETEVPEAEPEPVVETSGVALDEDFIWSAKVLADQGRAPEDVSEEEINWLSRLRQGLTKTRRNLVNQLKAVVGQGPLNQAAINEIEALLLQADVGIEATDYIITTLQNKLREEALPPEAAIAYLKSILREILDRPLQSVSNAEFVPEKETLNIWLLTGVNGAGKTTTIGKLAHLAQKSGYSCLIAAADTFRAAAVEQVKIWGDRSGTTVIANPDKNTDPAAVVFDGITAAQARNIELLLVDTAGRLQNKKNLMDELAKIRRIIDKKAPNAKVESLLVLDSTLGQNGLRQAEVFSQAAKLNGVILTKLDGSAKGGVAIAVAQQLNLPIRFIGAGEGIEDLRPFSSYEFVEALLNG